MNEQNSDSFSQEPNKTPTKEWVITSFTRTTWAVMSRLSHIFHTQKPSAPLPSPWEQNIHVSTDRASQSIMLKLRQLFVHKISNQPKSIEHVAVSDLPPNTNTPVENPISANTEAVSDTRLHNLLSKDIVYQSMIRSEDIHNIRLQLAMRYMLLLLAIFVVIAWVVNNRVIMFGFSDLPLLSRIRDALFAALTGLFSLTVWIGSSVWFKNRIIGWCFRVIALIIGSVVIVSLYFPFWR